MIELTDRLLPTPLSSNIVFEIIDRKKDAPYFEILSKRGRIVFRGDTPVSAAFGLNWYLKYHCQSHISWSGDQLDLPSPLPCLSKPFLMESLSKYSYYMNYCTFSYTAAFWDWERWCREIDWMALNGINLPLAALGMEKIWQNTLKKIGFTNEEITEFIPGPAFTPWWLMGNLEGWGGPVSQAYIDRRARLQKQILDRMRKFGMDPVLPGFYGMVPRHLKGKFPAADIRDQGKWAGGFDRPAFLVPTDPLFSRISSIYYAEMKKLYGEVKFLSGDPFHEGGKLEGIDLHKAGRSLIRAARGAFPDAVWVFQGWGKNPREDLLNGINSENLLIIDLDCDNRPQWEKRSGWGGKPWIWSIIGNFGGNTGMFGRLEVIAGEPLHARSHSSYSHGLCGIGAMMEGIENNPVVWDLLFEMRWRKNPPKLDAWLKEYAARRYGNGGARLGEAWKLLKDSVYGQKLFPDRSQQGTSESIVCARPAAAIPSVSTWGTSALYYDSPDLVEAWRLFMEESDVLGGNQNYIYDLIEITRQVLANHAQKLHGKIIEDFNRKDIPAFETVSKRFLRLVNDLDLLLNTDRRFMLGPWLHAARSMGSTNEEKDLFEFNARALITTWSYQDSNLRDYSFREWGGLMKDFYLPRWEMFFSNLSRQLRGETPPPVDYYPVEKEWTGKRNPYPLHATKNTLDVVKSLFSHYYPLLSK